MSKPEVTMAAMLKCSFGVAPSALMVLPINRVTAQAMPTATIQDHIPFLNIMPFAMCNSTSNPMVIALTAAALGVFTPAPCIPVTTTPWTPGTPTVTIGGQPALDTGCTLLCMWAGEITITEPAQMTVTVP
jgi:hypothetical protein